MDIKAVTQKLDHSPTLVLTFALALLAMVMAVYLYFFPQPENRPLVSAHADEIAVLDRAARKMMAARQFDQAIGDFDAALKLAPHSDDLLMGRAAAKYKKGDFAAAIVDYQAVAALSPASRYSSDAAFGVALSQKSLRQFTAATKTLHTLMARDGSYIKAYQLQGDIYLSDSNSEAAIDAYTQGLRRNPLSSVLHYDRGVAYLKRNMKDPAFDDMTRAVQLDEGNLGLLLKHANLARKLNKLEAADADALEILRLEPENASAQSWLKHRGKLPVPELEQGDENAAPARTVKKEKIGAK
ncbi:MAG: tetratricopeptide repeat protein [Cyanobacteria bacterium REEB67]|nr:tetratricopeptide repeat protein [Cyanobacteria bacterium REEB67]